MGVGDEGEGEGEGGEGEGWAAVGPVIAGYDGVHTGAGSTPGHNYRSDQSGATTTKSRGGGEPPWRP